LIEKLVQAARSANPRNEELKAVEEELFPNLKTKSLLQKGRQNSRPDSPEVSVKLDCNMKRQLTVFVVRGCCCVQYCNLGVAT
jgi:hypothetical protein